MKLWGSNIIILREIEATHGVSRAELAGACRSKRICDARRELWARLRDRGWSYPELGKLTGHDHTTVMYGVRKHRKEHPEELESAPQPSTEALHSLRAFATEMVSIYEGQATWFRENGMEAFADQVESISERFRALLKSV